MLALIVGASRGLGLELVREHLKRGWAVIATVRDAAGEAALTALPEHRDGRLRVEQVDVAEDAAMDALSDRLREETFDLLFLNAGVGSATDFMEVGSADSARVIHVNAVGPARLARLLLDRVREQAGVVAFMSSRMGSIAQDDAGGWEAYRASKTAQNAFARALAVKQAAPRGVTVLSFDPGWVKTGLGGPHATLGVEDTVPAMVDLVTDYGGRGGHHYLDHEGRTVPW